MTVRAYYDNIKAKTGVTPKEFKEIARKKGLLREGVKTGEIVTWLEKDFGLGRGHAMAIVLALRSATEPRGRKDDQIARHFRGNRSGWRSTYDQLVGRIGKFGSDVTVSPTAS